MYNQNVSQSHFIYRQNQDFMNYYNAMINLRNVANSTMPLLQGQEKLKIHSSGN